MVSLGKVLWGVDALGRSLKATRNGRVILVGEMCPFPRLDARVSRFLLYYYSIATIESVDRDHAMDNDVSFQ